MNISAVDLNLLVVLQAVFEEGTATKAARRLHVTRPAISNALARLRELFGDDLFSRTGRGLVPTPRAQQLRPAVNAVIDQVRGLLEQGVTFVPKESTRRFVIACSEYSELVVLPLVFERLEREAPNTSVRVVTVEHLLSGSGLLSGEIDAVVGLFPQAPPGCEKEALFDDDLVCVLRRDHPDVGRALTLDEIIQLGEIEVSIFGDRPSLGAKLATDALSMHGKSRNIAFTVPHFTAAVVAVTRSDHVAVLPRRLARRFARWMPIRLSEMPISFPPLPIAMVWPLRVSGDQGSRYLRQVLRECAQQEPMTNVPNSRRSRKRLDD